MPGFVSRRPLLFSLLAILVYLGGSAALAAVLGRAGLSRVFVGFAVQLAAALYVAWLLARLRWWGECGLAGRAAGRGLLCYAPWLLLPLLMLADVHAGGAGAGTVALYALWALLVGFAEEGLLRGVVLRALLPGGVMRAAVLSSLLFGLAHLTNAFAGRNPTGTVVQAVYATFIGIGFAGPFLRSGTLWPAVVLHGMIDFADYAGRGFAPANENAQTSLQQALPALLITGAYAVYGLLLLRGRGTAAGRRG